MRHDTRIISVFRLQDAVEYSLVAAADTEMVWTHFHVDAQSGAVVVRRSLRDLSGRTLRFGVKATDRLVIDYNIQDI